MLYLDTAATTPVHPLVAETVTRYFTEEFGNAGSRTHEWGTRAKRAVQEARERVATVASCKPDEVIFTSGATESDNLAILGLAEHGRASGRRHIISSSTEHKAVLEPLEYLSSQGFEVELVAPSEDGIVSPEDVLHRLRPDTLLVSLMLVNNETGVIQDVESVASNLRETETLFHVDAVQGFAKSLGPSISEVDMISLSGHKIAGPKGIGALITRRRGWNRVPLHPLMFGGGQERKLRPGTQPVPLIAGLGLAAEIMNGTAEEWERSALDFRERLLSSIAHLPHRINGDPSHAAPHILNVSFEGIDSEALIVALKDTAAIATGSACTSASYTPSHVLTAMGLPQDRIDESVRLSWWSDTNANELPALVEVLDTLKR